VSVKVSSRYLFGLFIKFIVLLCLIEVALWFLPACEQPYTVFDKASGLLKYDVNKQREGIYTDGNLAQIKADWHINNMGWNSEYDYTTDNIKPVIAVIGSSYIEAFQVDYNKNIVANLQNKLGDKYNCYNFGYSGSKLSQYLHVSRYIRKTFKPKMLIINIVDGDIIGSISTLAQQPQNMLFFIETPSAYIEAPVTTYIPSSIKRFFRKFALVRYITLNKQQAFSDYKLPGDVSLAPAEANKIYSVTNYAFGKIRQENLDTDILIVIDAPREEIYQGNILKKSLETRNIVTSISNKYGFQLLDLTGPMTDLYAKNQLKFNFENNYHWNEYGHKIVSAQICKKIETALPNRSVLSGEGQ